MGAFSHEHRSCSDWAQDLTRWRVWIILGEFHFRFEIATIVERVWVDDDESNVPVKNVICTQLVGLSVLMATSNVTHGVLTSTLTHFSWARALYSFMRMRSAMITNG